MHSQLDPWEASLCWRPRCANKDLGTCPKPFLNTKPTVNPTPAHSNGLGFAPANINAKRKADGAHEPDAKRLKSASTGINNGHASHISSTISSPLSPTVRTSSKRKADDLTDDNITAKRTKADFAHIGTDFATIMPAPGRLVPPEVCANPDIFPFPFLAPEIRLKIYGYLFKTDQVVIPIVKKQDDPEKRVLCRRSLIPRELFSKGVVDTMTRLNKQVSREVTHFLYTENTFLLVLPEHRMWLHGIGRRNSSAIRHLILHVGDQIPAQRQLVAVVNTLRKRATENLQTLTNYDRYETLTHVKVARQLVEADISWKPFKKLQRIVLDVTRSARQEPLKLHRPELVAWYEKLCAQSGVPITGTVRLGNPVLEHLENRSGPESSQPSVWLDLDPVAARALRARERPAQEKARALEKEKRKAWLRSRAEAKAQAQGASGQQGPFGT
ncbi:hypothetical protein VTK56DRAFT_5784 [Thermocarpiscus australiensis]